VLLGRRAGSDRERTPTMAKMRMVDRQRPLADTGWAGGAPPSTGRS
jgi:hypothetical protein